MLVQTLSPDAPSIVAASRHDADGFLAGELERRRALAYPPFASLIRVTCSAEEAGDANAAAEAVRERISAPAARWCSARRRCSACAAASAASSS